LIGALLSAQAVGSLLLSEGSVEADGNPVGRTAQKSRCLAEEEFTSDLAPSLVFVGQNRDRLPTVWSATALRRLCGPPRQAVWLASQIRSMNTGLGTCECTVQSVGQPTNALRLSASAAYMPHVQHVRGASGLVLSRQPAPTLRGVRLHGRDLARCKNEPQEPLADTYPVHGIPTSCHYK
jgi:hypothetical protein